MIKYCPRCPGTSGLSTVTDSRPTPGDKVLRRRRECTHCGYRWSTVELSEEAAKVVDVLPMVDAARRTAENLMRQLSELRDIVMRAETEQ